jgi:uncharacterized protein (DUF1800 family)
VITRVIITMATVAAVVAADAAARVVARTRGASSPHTSAMPYADAGLSDREAAAHLLDRFTFGPTPGLIDDVVAQGLDNWFEHQLGAGDSSPDLDAKLGRLQTLRLTNEDIVRDFPRPGWVRRRAIEEGRLDPQASEEAQRRALRTYYEEKGLQRPSRLLGELVAQKYYRAVHSPNQVEEVMVDFWFNHFYVTATDNQCRRFVGTYERDAIRPHVFTRFQRMLLASARHPAMLLYLDNAQSSADDGALTYVDYNKQRLRESPGMEGRRYDQIFDRMERNADRRRARMMEERPPEAQPRRGINENYARELLELHTLGVDGGYTQLDVVAVARALTGWTVVPERETQREKLNQRMSQPLSRRLGFAVVGDFFFNADWHDADEKKILGETFPRGGGLEEGERVLALLAEHPSTAYHIARKLAVRFVSDDPPAGFVEQLAVTFVESGGDLRELLWQIVRSPHFWSEHARRAKIKTPFELAASSVRALGADLRRPGQLNRWVERMGQPLYRYQAPTGFPDRAEMWVNAGSLLHRMNYGITLAAGRVTGVRVDLKAFMGAAGRYEPESAEAALEVCAAALLPERDLHDTMHALRPLVGRPQVAQEIRERSETAAPSDADSLLADELVVSPEPADAQPDATAPMTLSQIVGLILGSPEFQRR